MVFLKRFYDSLRVFCSFVFSAFQIIKASARITRLEQPIVSIFGGSRLKFDDVYCQQAFMLAQRLTESKISILTGGGAGIMDAAMQGEKKINGSGKRSSIGIGVARVNEGYVKDKATYIEVTHFWARKYLLTRHSSGIIIFPGGFGTLDELGEMLTLLQTKKIVNFPIVLMGTDYWRLVVEWINTVALHHGLIEPEHVKLFVVTDDINVAIQLVCKYCKNGSHRHDNQ